LSSFVWTFFAVVLSALKICSFVQSGCASFIIAIAPATCGVAILVPLSASYPSGTVLNTFTPGAIISGFNCQSTATGPRDLEGAIVSCLVPYVVEAYTVSFFNCLLTQRAFFLEVLPSWISISLSCRFVLHPGSRILS